VLSTNSHFSLHDGHSSGGASFSSKYPQFEHFQLGMQHLPFVMEYLYAFQSP